jgi:N,N-dimethylformamidase beta subunit-like, C-terminal/Bacterial Ig-like domain/Bacterial Ig domain
MGYYGGDGARLVDTVQPSAALPQNQPECQTDDATGLIDCGNWSVSASWAVPPSAVSGIYFAHLVGTDATIGESHIVFIVRDDSDTSDVLFQTSDTTWQAYNSYGGNSLYTGGPAGRAYKVSYNRPFATRGAAPEDWVFNAEYPMVRFLERNGYDVSYFSGVDSDVRGTLIARHKTFLSVGHDEYWSGQQRDNVEAARDAGVSLAFFSGNEVFWKTRWEPSNDGSSTPNRTLVCFKETHANAKIDPQSSVWTGTWRDPRPFNPQGGRPENALTGTIFKVNSGTTAIEVPAADGRMRLWRNTSVASQPPGATATLSDSTLGYEWDEDADNGSRPAGLVRLSSTTLSGAEVLQDYGSTYAGGTATHHLTLYRRGSALVFGAGTVQWAWGLDANHDRGSAPADARMQQATVNLLADMGSQPSSPQPGLTPASASGDTTAPSTTITSPADGASIPAGVTTITGTAQDSGGGVVGGVEVSTDGGGTWHPAEGRETWRYTWTNDQAGPVPLLARAADDSGNLAGTAPPDQTAPRVTSVTPAAGSEGVDPGTRISATFDQAMSAGSVNGASFQLRDPAGALVPVDVSYSAATRTATLTPRAALASGSVYTGTVRGGAAGVKDASGDPLAQPHTWSFTTSGAPTASDQRGIGETATGAAAGGASPAGGFAAPSATTGRTGPKVTVTPRRARVSAKGAVTLRARCADRQRSCRVQLTLRLGRRTVASKTATVAPARTRSLTLTLSRSARRELQRKGSLNVTAVALTTDSAGRKATTHTSIRLLRSSTRHATTRP